MNSEFDSLNPALASEFSTWVSHPELSKLLKKWNTTEGPQWYDHYAEAMVARYLLQEGCELAVEVPTNTGKGADFKVTKGREAFFVHVKRLNVDDKTRAHHNWYYQQFLKLRELEEIPRPLLVEVNLRRRLTKGDATNFVKIAKPFIEQAQSQGERFTVVAANGEELGCCEILQCSVMGGRVILHPDSDYEKPRNSTRVLSKLKKAYEQFMPNATNVIFVAGECTSRFEFEAALWGEYQWLRDDETKQIIKSTNPLDGFWSGDKFSDSQLAVWLEIQEDAIDFQLFVRERLNPIVPQLVARLFTPRSSGELPRQKGKARL